MTHALLKEESQDMLQKIELTENVIAWMPTAYENYEKFGLLLAVSDRTLTIFRLFTIKYVRVGQAGRLGI